MIFTVLVESVLPTYGDTRFFITELTVLTIADLPS